MEPGFEFAPHGCAVRRIVEQPAQPPSHPDTPFADMITGCGLAFHGAPAELQLAADGSEVQPMKGLAAFASPAGMRAWATTSSPRSQTYQPTSSCCPVR